jgi:hypothetical protein
MAVPGLTPILPSMSVSPVFVTVVAPRTPNCAAVPIFCAPIRAGPTRLQARRIWLHIMIVSFVS